MSFLMRLATLSSAGLLAAVLLAPLIKAAVDALRAAEPGLDSGYDFGRIFRRLLQISILTALLAGRRWLTQGRAIRVRGLRASQAPWSRFSLGLLSGIVSLSLFLASHAAWDGGGGLEIRLQPVAAWPPALAWALLTGLVVAAIEEMIFRGWLLEALRLSTPFAVAALVSSMLYGAAHFVAAAVRVRPGWDFLVGLQAVDLHLRALARPELAMVFLVLAAAGFVLACAYAWTASLPFAIGIHAGWVFVIKAAPLMVPSMGIAWLHGSGGALSGIWSLVFLGALLVVLRFSFGGRRS